MMFARRHIWVTLVAAIVCLGCGSKQSPPQPIVKTNATYPQHENVAKFIAVWKDRLNPNNQGSLEKLTPIGVDRSQFQDALSLATKSWRNDGKAYYRFQKRPDSEETEGNWTFYIFVDEASDRIEKAFYIGAVY